MVVGAESGCWLVSNRVSLYRPPLSGTQGSRDDGLCSGQPRASVPTSPFWRGQPQKMVVGAEFGGWLVSNRVSLYRPPLYGMNGPRDDGLRPGQPRESVPTSPFWHPRPTGRRPWPLHSAERSPVHAARRSKSPERGRLGRSQCCIRACRRSGLVGVGTSKIICNHPGTRVPAFRTLCTACPYWTG